jgi:hypothetical protein
MATHIRKIIQNFLKTAKSDIQTKTRIQKLVNTCLDKKLKKHTYFKGIYKNKIILGSESSSASYVFNLKKQKLLKAIQKEFPQIEDIKVNIG